MGIKVQRSCLGDLSPTSRCCSAAWNKLDLAEQPTNHEDDGDGDDDNDGDDGDGGGDDGNGVQLSSSKRRNKVYDHHNRHRRIYHHHHKIADQQLMSKLQIQRLL